jgi:hypothetical protein
MLAFSPLFSLSFYVSFSLPLLPLLPPTHGLFGWPVPRGWVRDSPGARQNEPSKRPDGATDRSTPADALLPRRHDTHLSLRIRADSAASTSIASRSTLASSSGLRRAENPPPVHGPRHRNAPVSAAAMFGGRTAGVDVGTLPKISRNLLRLWMSESDVGPFLGCLERLRADGS